MAAEHRCCILADVYERRSGVIEALRRRGVEVEIQHLDAGDYRLTGHVLVERKTVSDFHESLRRGRLWGQIGRLRNAAQLPYLLLEGRRVDAGPLRSDAVRGALLAVIGQGVPLIVAETPSVSACWLHLLALRAKGVRSSRDRPIYAQRLTSRRELVPEAMLAAVPGISVVGARALLAQFGTVAGVVAAGYDAWLRVPGIGPARASALRDAFS
jgi:Fanconi anemia group M protein